MLIKKNDIIFVFKLRITTQTKKKGTFMKKKFGFTLAEVLITLGIIGVVSALTAPALSTNTQKAKIGPALARFSSVLGGAIQEYMVNNDLTDLSDETVGDDFLNKLSNYMVMEKLDASQCSYNVMLGSSTNYKVQGCYQLNDGTIISRFKSDANNYWAYIDIDINGTKKPNQIGKDCFEFIIYPDGRVLAFGSNAMKNKTPAYKNYSCNPNYNGTDSNYR